jgi:anti-sigma factor RsiW
VSTCRDLAASLYELASGELPPDRRRELEEHLGYCPPCAALVQTYQITVQLGHRLPPCPMPPQTFARLQRTVLGRGPSPGLGAAPPPPG